MEVRKMNMKVRKILIGILVLTFLMGSNIYATDTIELEPIDDGMFYPMASELISNYSATISESTGGVYIISSIGAMKHVDKIGVQSIWVYKLNKSTGTYQFETILPSDYRTNAATYVSQRWQAGASGESFKFTVHFRVEHNGVVETRVMTSGSGTVK
jgi:hypothetical protein